MTTAPAHNEPSVLADGFLGIAFRRLREGMLLHMRSVLGTDVASGPQKNRRTVQLTDTDDLYYLLGVWLDNKDNLMRSFTPNYRNFILGRNLPCRIMEFRSEKWARQSSYADADAGDILDATSEMLKGIASAQKTESAERLAREAEQLAEEFEFYLHSPISLPDASGMDGSISFTPAEGYAVRAITTRPDEPDVFAEGFLTRAWRRFGEGLGPYMERITGHKPDNPRDVRAMLSGNLDKVDQRIHSECSNLLAARNEWAHQGNYTYRRVRIILGDAQKVLLVISENELAQVVKQMREYLSGLHLPAAVDRPDDHDSTVILPVLVASSGVSVGIFPTARSAPELFHRAFDTLAGTALVLPSETPVALSPSHAGDSVRLADTAEDYYQRGEWQNAVDAASVAIARNFNLAAAYLVRGRAHGRLGNMEAAGADFAAANRLDPDIRQSLEEAVNFFNRGADAFGRGEIDFAIGNFIRAIELNPQYARAYHSRGIAYNHKGEHDLAIDDFTRAIELNPEFVAAYHDRGFARDNKGELDLAIADYDTALSIDRKSFASYYNRGIARYHKGDYDWAIADFDAALSINPRLDNAYINRGIARYHKGDYDRAIDDCNAALSINSQLDTAYNNRGLAYCSKGDYDQAIADHNVALSINSQSEYDYTNRGNVYHSKGEYDRAIADFDTALSINPKFAAAYHNRGFAYNNKGDYDQAIADFDAALSIDPQNAKAYIGRGNAYEGKGDYERAIADYDEAIRINPQDFDVYQYVAAYIGRGVVHFRKGDYDRAIADYDAALSVNSQDVAASQYAAAYNNRGVVHLHKGDYDRAIADFDAALSVNSQDVAAYRNRGVAHHLKGDDLAIADFDAALELVTNDEMLRSLRERREQVIRLRDAMIESDQATTDNPEDPVAWHLRGLHYRDDRENYDRAIADFTEAIRLTPDNAEILYDRGLAHKKLGDDDSALSDYGSAVAIKPDYSEAYCELGMIRTRRRQHQEAIADFDQAIAYKPAYAEAYYRRSFCYHRLGNEEQARADFNKSAQLGFNP